MLDAIHCGEYRQYFQTKYVTFEYRLWIGVSVAHTFAGTRHAPGIGDSVFTKLQLIELLH